MAKIKTSALVAEARGKIGGNVFSRNRYGMYVRRFAAPVQPNTPFQEAQRSNFTAATQYWSKTLTASQRAAWEDYAAGTPLKDRLGESIQLSGNAMFCRHAAVWLRLGSAVVTTAPTTPGEAGMPTVTLTGSVADKIKVTAYTPSGGATDQMVMLMCAAPQTQARNFFKGPFTWGGSWALNTATPITLSSPDPVAVGQRYFLQFRVFMANGKVGPAATFRVDILA